MVKRSRKKQKDGAKLPLDIKHDMSRYFTIEDVLNLYASGFFTQENDINYILSKINNKEFITYTQIRQLLDYGANDFTGFTIYAEFHRRGGYIYNDVMAQAIINDDIEVVQLLLNTNDFDINNFDINNQTALEVAILYNNAEIVELLLENGAMIYDELEWLMKFPSLISALENPDIDMRIVQLLLQYGADCDSVYDDYTPLIMAIENGNIDAVELLIESGANVNVQTQGRRSIQTTALIEASQNGNVEIVRLLLENGADPNIENRRGFNALHYADSDDIIKLLNDQI